jgi:hypothetical protein
MILTGEEKSTGEKPVPVPIGPPQISHGLAWHRTHEKRGAGEVNSKVVVIVLWKREESIS